MSVRRIPCAHLRHGVSKQAAAAKDIGVFSKETEDQPRHKVVHFMALFFGAPSGVVLQQLHIQPIQAVSSADIKLAIAQLFNGGDTLHWQQEAGVVWKSL